MEIEKCNRLFESFKEVIDNLNGERNLLAEHNIGL